MTITGDIPLDRIIAGVSVIIIALAGSIPTIKRKLAGKKMVMITLAIAEFLQALRDYSNYTVQIVELRRSIEKKQKLAATDSSALLKMRILSVFAKLAHENQFTESVKDEFESAIENVLLDMRRKMYDIFEANHFIEREDWPAFLNIVSGSLYQEGYNKLIKHFPRYAQIPGFYQAFKEVENELKDEIKKTFDNAKTIILHVHAEIIEIEQKQEREIQIKYIDAQM